jgi:hypothetical protein
MHPKLVWWRYRAAEFTLAVILLASALYLTDYVQQRSRADVPAANWFTVNDIYIPDFHAGENPTVVYDRTIKEPFRGFWVMEVERFDGEGKTILECTGAGVNDYEVTDYIPNNEVTFEWFLGKKCPDLEPGSYRIRGTWKMKRDGWPEKQIIKYSNEFKVR